ncbi:PREDICTED: placental protein 13-like [Rhinopithecus bieti]|uniref:Galectin n=1 Tax=Rhinopithecus bieti TaxID=61621 RepID=A0A2K6MZV3_RHIBE|nr:PREDICTED: placental protein 13-like [Rhinopithecus bieti]
MSSLPVPYTVPVSFSIGSCVIIRGKPNLSFVYAPQLEVNFYTEMDEDSDIAFQFRVHFGYRAVINSREFGIWMCEEKCYNVPFEDGKSFELRIYVRRNKYKIKVNGQCIYNFVHRLPLKSVKMVQVWRNVSLTRVLVSNGWR